MANLNPPAAHLMATRWQSGSSGNKMGKPKGRLNISTHVRKLLENDRVVYGLGHGIEYGGTPLEAILRAMLVRAIQGDTRACELILKYAYGNKIEVTEPHKVMPILGGITK